MSHQQRSRKQLTAAGCSHPAKAASSPNLLRSHPLWPPAVTKVEQPSRTSLSSQDGVVGCNILYYITLYYIILYYRAKSCTFWLGFISPNFSCLIIKLPDWSDSPHLNYSWDKASATLDIQIQDRDLRRRGKSRGASLGGGSQTVSHLAEAAIPAAKLAAALPTRSAC